MPSGLCISEEGSPADVFLSGLKAEEKYRVAVELYRTTDMSITEISKVCGVSRSGFAVYIQRHHRDLMYARHEEPSGGDCNPRLRPCKGQRRSTADKYAAAIEACGSEAYMDLNVSQIACLYGLDGPALANQLRIHFPEVLSRRRAVRDGLGLDRNVNVGVRHQAMLMYAEAVAMLRDAGVSVREAAVTSGVSFSGLKQHMLYYHKELVGMRADSRRESAARVLELSDDDVAEVLRLCRESSMALDEMARMMGVGVAQLRRCVVEWHRKAAGERRRRDTADKYAEAVSMLESAECSTEAVARSLGLVPESLRLYVKGHEPELYRKKGMMRLPNGRMVLRRSYEKYAAALELYGATAESLRSIAGRLGLAVKSVSGFIRRNCPELIDEHNRLVAEARSKGPGR